MKITEFSIRNPLIVAALTLVLAGFGIVSYLSMGIGVTPNVNFPTVSVITVDPGSDPSTVETQITKPIEDAIATLPHIDILQSTSNEGVSAVTVQFTTAVNSDLISVDVERVVSGVRNQLPATAEAPTISKFDTSVFPVITLAVSGPQSLDQINQVTKDRIKRSLDVIPGVQAVTVGGGRDREIHVNVDPKKLEAYGIGMNTVQVALQTEQLQVPAGLLTSGGRDINVRLNGLVTSPEQLGLITVANTPKGSVFLRDVATIEDDFERLKVINRLNGKSAVTVTVTKLGEGNTLAISDNVHRAIEELQPSLPQGMQIDVVTDAATYTRKSFETIQRTLIEAIILTGIILLLFLHTWRSTSIVLVSIPTSLLTTFGAMNLLGLNLNLFSMLAVTLSVGILVDDSIVVLENISRHIEHREAPVLAAIRGRSEIGLAALTITMVDVVVYLPIALITGIVGDFLRPFALVIAIATLMSLLVSFTLTPLLASRLFSPGEEGKARGALAAFGRVWETLVFACGACYVRSVQN